MIRLHSTVAVCALIVAYLALIVSASSGEDKGEVMVTCGSLVKLEHQSTGHLLHSHEVSYGVGRGSGQQSVTGYPQRDSSGSLWIVRGVEQHCPQGTLLKIGAKVRLQHSTTGRWLHSHHFSSPLSSNQEISCFGSNDQSDSGDTWIVEWDGQQQHWQRDVVVRLKHQDTGAYLASHDVKYDRPIPGHTEIYGAKKAGKKTSWKSVEGVYFPQREAES